MSRERFKARDKVTNKMSKNGLIERNVATGEDKRISNREGEFDIRTDSQFDIAKQRSIHDSSNPANIRISGDFDGNKLASKPQRNTILSQSEPEQKVEIDQRYADMRQPHIGQSGPQKFDSLSAQQFENTITSQREINPSTTTQNSLHHQHHSQSDNQRTVLHNYNQKMVQNNSRQQQKRQQRRHNSDIFKTQEDTAYKQTEPITLTETPLHTQLDSQFSNKLEDYTQNTAAQNTTAQTEQLISDSNIMDQETNIILGAIPDAVSGTMQNAIRQLPKGLDGKSKLKMRKDSKVSETIKSRLKHETSSLMLSTDDIDNVKQEDIIQSVAVSNVLHHQSDVSHDKLRNKPEKKSCDTLKPRRKTNIQQNAVYQQERSQKPGPTPSIQKHEPQILSSDTDKKTQASNNKYYKTPEPIAKYEKSTTFDTSYKHEKTNLTVTSDKYEKTPAPTTSYKHDESTSLQHEPSKISPHEQQDIQLALESEIDEGKKAQPLDVEKGISFENPRDPPIKTRGKSRGNRLTMLQHDEREYPPSAIKHDKPKSDFAFNHGDKKRPQVETNITENLNAVEADTIQEPKNIESDDVRIDGDYIDNDCLDTSQPETKEKADKPRKLQFTEDEKTPSKPTNRRLANANQQAERVCAKLEKAKNKLPAKRKLVYKRVFDEKAGKARHKLNFEKTVKTQGQHLKGPLPLRPIKMGANSALAFGHRKLFQVEHENVGTKAAHRAELLVEGGVRSALHFHKTAPYRKVAKLEREATKKAIKLTYQRTLAENPKLESNLFSRMWHKRKIRKDYAKSLRETQKAAKRIKKIGATTSKTFKAIADVVRRHPAAASITVIVILLLFFMMSFMSSLSNIVSGGLASIVATSYLSSDADIDSAELSYTEWETDLKLEIDNAEQDHPNYDEYIYNVGDIRHNPYELIAFLTAVYQDYKYADIESVLQQIFNEQYQLTFTPTTETRYRTNPDGSRTAYTWKTLTITLTTRSFTEIAYSRMNNEQRDIYDLLMESKGNRQYVDSPFDTNWLTCVTSYYGYRIHPTSGAKDYHKGVDIAVPIGTNIHAGFDGEVTDVSYDSGGYGHYVVIENDKDVVAKYAHCDSVLVSVGQTVTRGDIIAKSGNSGISTGPHLHLEVLKDGLYLNPLIFAVTNAEFGTEPEYGDPGSPLGDGSYAALIAEAEKHLGKAYVFGANGPNNFDCSSYICWIFTKSGVKNMPRTTAQGIYNQCTPIPASEAKPGDIIFFQGTYSTSDTVTHVGLYVGNNRMIHTGNPTQYANLTGYWQQHFYSFGRLK